MNAFKTKEGKHAVMEYYDKLLEKLTVPYERISIQTRWGNTSVLTAGDPSNPPLVLLHGSSMNSAMWIGDMNVYSKRYRVYAPDMPGEPGRSSEEQLPFDNMAYVEWLLDVINKLGICGTAIAGISLGAWLAAKFSIHYPHMVGKLVLLCPAGIGSQNHRFKDIAMSLLLKGEEGVDELFRQINGGVDMPELMLNYQKLIAAVCNTRQEVIPVFTDEELNKLDMPSLLIVGEKDIMLNSLETAERYQEFVPNGEVLILPDAGHSLTGLTAEISAFLEK